MIRLWFIFIWWCRTFGNLSFMHRPLSLNLSLLNLRSSLIILGCLILSSYLPSRHRIFIKYFQVGRWLCAVHHLMNLLGSRTSKNRKRNSATSIWSWRLKSSSSWDNKSLELGFGILKMSLSTSWECSQSNKNKFFTRINIYLLKLNLKQQSRNF